VSAKELVNLYIDICDQILVDNNLNQNNKYLFFSSLEQSIDQFAINLHTELNLNISILITLLSGSCYPMKLLLQTL